MNFLSKNSLPQELLRLKEPPEGLFYQGRLDLLNMTKIAVVGSRKATNYTKECVTQLCQILNTAGICVVSGGAIGVDIFAHKAAMPQTIGVFATGLDIIYPPSNKNIINQIYEQGLALSEYKPKTLPLGFRFLQRNRIIIALSKAIVIAQADLKSGSMQSARLALEIGVPVFVLPQRINESTGTNTLLMQKKAQLINDFREFAQIFSTENTTHKKKSDEILDFCKNGVSLDEAILKFKDRIYEYELLGKLEIRNLHVYSVENE